MRSLAIGLSILLLHSLAHSSIRPTISLVPLTLYADAIVEIHISNDTSEQVKRNAIHQFRIAKVYLDNTNQIENIISIDTRFQYFRVIDWSNLQRAVVFLERAGNSDKLITSGLRALSKDDSVLYPIQIVNPGGYYLKTVNPEVSWSMMINRITETVGLVQSLKSAGNGADKLLKNKKLFKWIDVHRAQVQKTPRDGIQHIMDFSSDTSILPGGLT